MRQYWDVKKAHPDSIMLFRMGDFYETFEEDAKITSKTLGIALTKRANGAASTVPLAGFPYHALEQHVYKLLNSGYKVALCEQVEDPKEAKGIVKRSVVEVLTPGTAISAKYLNSNDNNFIISLYFFNNNFGYSILDNSTGEFYCGNSNINNLKEILGKYEIKEILISKKQKYIINDLVNNILITTYDDWKTDKSICYDKLTEHFETKSLKGFGIENEDLCIISSGTCLYYLETNYLKEMKHINSISLLRDDGYMKLDSFTIKNLELFSSINNKTELGTLINTINKTITSQGERLLKKHIRRPLYNKNRIKNRLKIQSDLMKNSDLNDKIRKILKEVDDIERIISKISNNKSNPRDILNLGRSLEINSFINKIIPKKITTIKSLISKSKNTTKISKKILSTIKNEPSINLLKGGYIKSNVNRKLDEYRDISDNVNKWLINYQIKEQKKTNIPSLKIKYNKVFGYYIDVTKVHLNKIPENYIRKQTLVNSERYYTVELKKYEEKIISAETKIVDIEREIYNKLMLYILNNVDVMQINAQILAKIDVASSNTTVAIENNYSKPTFCNKIELKLEKSRHPVVEKLLPLDKEFIQNDLSMKQKNEQIAIITGPNMAGKSTFLRQVGHIIILAQIGSYVPAQSCKLSLVDQLFTRVGASDNIAEGESTFLVEMNEAAYILNNASENSFIILDEIGRGTSTFDGLSLAWAITEYLHNNKKIKARTLFATHYHELIYLADELNDAFNLNVKVKEHDDDIIFLRKIVKGGASKSYGIQVAKMAGLPYKVIKRSKVLLESFMKDKKKINQQSKESSSMQDQLDLFNIDLDIIEELKNIKIDELTPIQALNQLNKMKKKYDL